MARKKDAQQQFNQAIASTMPMPGVQDPAGKLGPVSKEAVTQDLREKILGIGTEAEPQASSAQGMQASAPLTLQSPAPALSQRVSVDPNAPFAIQEAQRSELSRPAAPAANPLLSSAPITLAPGAYSPPPQATMTPYGPVTIPAGQPNALAGPGGVFDARLATPQGQAAEAYRNLPANASPVERAAAMADYRNALLTERGGLRQAQAAADYAGAMGQREARIAEEAVQSGRSPATAVEYYRTLTPEQQAQRYYSLWTSKTGPGIAENAPSLRQEAIVKSKVSDAARIDRNLSAAIRDAREGGEDEKGRKTKPDRALAASLQEEQRAHRLKEHLVDPANPQAGLNRDYAERARRNDLLSDAATLSNVARAEQALTEQGKTAGGAGAREGESIKTSEQARQQLAAQAEAARRAQEEEFRRRQFARFLGQGNLAAAY